MSAPAEFVSEDLISQRQRNTKQALASCREETKVGTNNIRDLLGLAMRVSERDGETVLRNVSDSSTGLLVTPDSPGRIDPASVRGITVLGNQL